MMKEYKRQMKLLKYGFNVKTSIISAALFFVLGIVFIFSSFGENIPLLGYTYIVLGPMMLIQIIYTNLMSGLVAASPQHRFIEVNLCTFLTFLVTMFAQTLLVVIAICAYSTSSNSLEISMKFGRSLAVGGFMSVWLCMYFAIVYKKYWFSVIWFAIVFGVLESMTFLPSESMPVVTLGAGIIIGYVLVILANLLAMLARKLVYKSPISKYSMGAIMRKQM